MEASFSSGLLTSDDDEDLPTYNEVASFRRDLGLVWSVGSIPTHHLCKLFEIN